LFQVFRQAEQLSGSRRKKGSDINECGMRNAECGKGTG